MPYDPPAYPLATRYTVSSTAVAGSACPVDGLAPRQGAKGLPCIPNLLNGIQRVNRIHGSTACCGECKPIMGMAAIGDKTPPKTCDNLAFCGVSTVNNRYKNSSTSANASFLQVKTLFYKRLNFRSKTPFYLGS